MTIHHKGKATTKQFVLLLAALALLLPLTGWMVVRIQGPKAEADAYANLAAIARLKTDQIENWLGERHKNAEMLSADAVFAQSVVGLQTYPASSTAQLAAILQRFSLLRTAFDYDTIDLLALDGQVLASMAGPVESTPRYDGFLPRLMQAEQAVRLDLNVNAQGQAQLRWLLPIYDVSKAERRLIAVVLMGISPDRFLFPVIQTWPTSSPSGETLLVNREGDQAVFMNELRHRSGTAMKLRLPLADAKLPAAVALRASEPGLVQGEDHRKVPVLAAYRPVAGTDWRVVAKIDRAEVLEPVHVLAWWVSAVTTLAIVALAVVLGLFWRQVRRTQRLEAMAQKARSDQLMERFFSLPFIGIATGDLSQPRWGRFNRHFCSIVGYTPEQMEHLGWADLVNPDDLAQDLQGVERLMRGEINAYAVDRSIRRGDGTEAFVSLQLGILDEEGGGKRCIVMLQDITQRHQAEIKIKRQSHLYAALSACNQAIVQCNSAEALFTRICQTAVTLGGMQSAWIGTLDPVTRRLVVMASYGSGAVEPGLWLDPAHNARMQGMGSASTAIREDRQVWIQDIPNARPAVAFPLHRHAEVVGVFVLIAGDEGSFDLDAQALLSEMASDMDFALGYFEHEAQRKRTEELLRQSQTQLELVLKGSTDAPWDCNLVTQTMEYSPQGWHMLGYGVDDMPRGPVRLKARIHPQDLGRIRQIYERLLTSDDSVVVEELRLRHKSGRYVPVLARGFVSRDASGHPVRVTGTNMDLTVQHQNHQKETLRAFALELVASELEIDQILRSLVGKMEELLPTDRGVVWLVDERSGQIVPRAASAMENLMAQARAVMPLEEGEGSWGWVDFSVGTTDPQALANSHLRSIVHSMAHQAGLTACWSVPILSDARQIVGVLDVHRRRKVVVDPHDITLMERVTHFMGSAIKRKAFEAQERLAAEVFSHSHDGIMVTDAHHKILLVNPAFTAITGYSPEEVQGRNPRILASGRHDAAFYGSMWRRIHADNLWQGEMWNQRKNGEVYPQWLTISRVANAEGEATHFIAIFSDVSQRKADEQRIRWMAHFDLLTGLPNRALLSDRFAHDLSIAERGGEPLALMFLDLDHFKNINDSLGHGIGDELLIAVARRMRQQVREQDTVARMGGDEFVLVLPNTDADGAAHLARKLIDAIAAPIQIREHELMVTPSLGIAMYPDDGHDLESLAQHADVAMYRSKQDGRNAYRFYSSDMQSHSARTLLLEGALRRALERNQLALHYQPQRSLKSDRIIGVEALLRWHHPELGMVSPAEFIPIAEKSGLILPIGEWVLRTAVQQLARWMGSGMPSMIMAVNISAIQFRHPNLPDLVTRILQDAGVAPECLELELTEGVASNDPDRAIAIMADLHARGVRMSIDDFGTGYSSLSYLKRFQVYKLKIDRSFVQDIMTKMEDWAIVNAIIRMASSLGMQTIAEGVETQEQLDALRAQGCDEVQGYFCSRPLPAQECEKFLRAQTLLRHPAEQA